MEKEVVHEILKRRFISGVIDFYGFHIITLTLMAIINIRLLDIVIYISCFILYFGVFTVMTNGYTVGGKIFNIRIVSIDNNKIRNPFKYSFRMLLAIYAVIKYRTFNNVKINSLGQLFYDEEFKTTVLDSRAIFDNTVLLEYYEFNLMFFYGKLFSIFSGILLVYILVGNLIERFF